MRLLFIKLKHIGDALLLTPTLTAVRERYPSAVIWVVVRRGTEGILRGCPAIDQLLTTAAPEAAQRSWTDLLDHVRLIRRLRRQSFDHAFELGDGDRGRFLAWASGARSRCALDYATGLGPLARRMFSIRPHFEWRHDHRVEKDYRTVAAALELPVEVPPLTFHRSRTEPWAPAENLGNFAVLHPGTRWQRKRWPLDRWVEIGRRLLEVLPQCVVSAGPDPEERVQAEQICRALGERAISTEGQASWAQLADLLYRARLFVGVDTAAMHLAAACRCPTVALFGPSLEKAWSPWRVRHRLVMAPGCELDPKESDYFRRKGELSLAALDVAPVWAACQEMLRLGRSIELPPAPAKLAAAPADRS